jgi:hypothetical protein
MGKSIAATSEEKQTPRAASTKNHGSRYQSFSAAMVLNQNNTGWIKKQ